MFCFLFFCFLFLFWRGDVGRDGGVDFRSYADWLVRRQYVINVIWRRTKCGRVKCALLPGSVDCLTKFYWTFWTWFAPFPHCEAFMFSMNVNLKMFCILCLCIILCNTSKASENLTLFWSCRVFCCHHYLLSGCHEDQRLWNKLH